MPTSNTSPADISPIQHSHVEVHDFTVSDTTHRDPAYWRGEFVSVNYQGEGRVLSPADARALAEAILAAANAAAARQQAAEVAPEATPKPLLQV